MAKTSSVERNKKRERLVKQYASRRNKLKAIVDDRGVSAEERFEAVLRLAELPRHSAPSRVPLRRDRTLARQLSQVQAVPHSAAGTWLQGPNPRFGQVKLVGRREK